MKLEIFDNKKYEKKVTLRLIEEDDYIYLCVVDDDGEVEDFLLSITTEGKLRLNNDISDDLGFQLDEKGRLKVFR